MQNSERSRIGLMPVDSINGDDIIWFDADPAMAFHSACAWDTPSGVEVYVCQHSAFNYSNPTGSCGTLSMCRRELVLSKRSRWTCPNSFRITAGDSSSRS